jgi:hypothetical protein
MWSMTEETWRRGRKLSNDQGLGIRKLPLFSSILTNPFPLGQPPRVLQWPPLGLCFPSLVH